MENGLISGTTDFRATGSVNTARTGILTGLIGVGRRGCRVYIRL